MPVSHALVREISLFEETAFVTGGPADWSADGSYFYATGVDVSGIQQAAVASENNRIRSARNVHPNIRGLRSGSTISFGAYMHGSMVNADAGDPAVANHISTLLRAALGGRDLGYASAFSSGTVSAPQLASDPGYAVGDWIWAYDDSAGVGRFYKIMALPGGNVLTLDRDLHFVPDPADKAYAVIDCYVHPHSTTRYDHAQHKTLQFFVQGEDSEDVYVVKGCKPALTLDPITAGTPAKLLFDVGCATFQNEDAIWEDFSGSTVLGLEGSIPGMADATHVSIATVGADLVEVTTYGAVTVNPGVTWEQVTGPNGYEGVHGWVDALADSTLEMKVAYDNTYATAFRADTRKHALIEIGETPDVHPWGIYMPNLEFAAEPKRAEGDAVTSSTLTFRAHMESGALSTDNDVKNRSSFHILLVA